jgi:uncharacterized protein YsxB (DUF464 family)
MVTITVFVTENGDYAGYRFEGHADSAPYGEDLVCAAASILAVITENSLEVQHIPHQGQAQSGLVWVQVPVLKDQKQHITAQAVLTTLAVGAKQLAKSYPKYITVKDQVI